MRTRAFPATASRAKDASRELVALAAAIACVLAMVFGLSAASRARHVPMLASSSPTLARGVHVAKHAAHADARKSLPRPHPKVLDDDDDDDGDHAQHDAAVSSGHRHARGLALAPRPISLPFRDIGFAPEPAPVESRLPQRLFLATHDARGPPTA